MLEPTAVAKARERIVDAQGETRKVRLRIRQFEAAIRAEASSALRVAAREVDDAIQALGIADVAPRRHDVDGARLHKIRMDEAWANLGRAQAKLKAALDSAPGAARVEPAQDAPVWLTENMALIRALLDAAEYVVRMDSSQPGADELSTATRILRARVMELV